MNKASKALLGIFVSLPGAYVVFFVLAWLYTLGVNFLIEGPVVTNFFFDRRLFFGKLFMLAVIVAIALWFAFVGYVISTKRFDYQAKAVLLILAMGHIVVLPLYWYLIIWRETPFLLLAPPNKSLDRSRGERLSHQA
jgi:hypothetical protein